MYMYTRYFIYYIFISTSSSGMSGSGKSFTADRLIVKMFSNSMKSDWLQDIRKVQDSCTIDNDCVSLLITHFSIVSSSIGRYHQSY